MIENRKHQPLKKQQDIKADSDTRVQVDRIQANAQVLQRSSFAHLFQNNGVMCIFHALTRRMLFGGQLLADLFEAFKTPVSNQQVIAQFSDQYSLQQVDSLVEAFRERNLLIQSPDEDASTYRRCFTRGLAQYHIHHMYLLPTSNCNFRCTYCFLEDDQRPFLPSNMDLATAEQSVQVFEKLARGNGRASVTFYGGEPLLNPKTTFFALRLLRRLQKEGAFSQGLDISLLTNGSLVDDEAIQVFQETHPGIGISIDGPRYLHESARKDTRGIGTFDSAIRGFKRLQEAGLRPSVSCTLSSFTIQHMDEIVDFVINDLHPGGMGFNLLLPRVGSSGPYTTFDHEFASHELIRAFKRLRSVGIYEDRVMRRVKPYIEKREYYKDCMGVGGQIVIGPSGQVGPCQVFLGFDDKKYFPLDVRQLAALGESLSSDVIYADPLFNEWRQRFPFNMAPCADCFAISICGGGCPYAAVVNNGSIWEIDDRVCFQAKNILEWMIWDTYSNMDAESND